MQSPCGSHKHGLHQPEDQDPRQQEAPRGANVAAPWLDQHFSKHANKSEPSTARDDVARSEDQAALPGGASTARAQVSTAGLLQQQDPRPAADPPALSPAAREDISSAAKSGAAGKAAGAGTPRPSNFLPHA